MRLLAIKSIYTLKLYGIAIPACLDFVVHSAGFVRGVVQRALVVTLDIVLKIQRPDEGLLVGFFGFVENQPLGSS